VERNIWGRGVVRVLKRLTIQRGLPEAIRPAKQRQGVLRHDLCLSMHTPAARCLRLIEPRKPSQNKYVERFNGRPRDERLTQE